MLFSGTLNLITYVMSEYTRSDIKNKISKILTSKKQNVKLNKDSVYYEEKVDTLFRTKDYQIIIRTFEPRTR